MDGARDQLLPRATLSGNEDRHFRRRDPHDLREQVAHRRGAADQLLQLVAAAELVREQTHIDEQLSFLQRSLHADEKLLLLERLGQVVVCALLHGGDGALDGAVRRHDYDLCGRRDLQGASQHRGAVERRHLQVGQHDVEGLGEESRKRRLAALRLDHLVAGLAQHERGGGAHVPLIVDDQDPGARSNRGSIRRQFAHVPSLVHPESGRKRWNSVPRSDSASCTRPP